MNRLFVLTILLVALASVRTSAQIVYASDKGEKFHTADCNLSGDAKDMRLATAEKAGKKACAVCKPEQHFKDKTVRCKGRTADGTRCKRMTASKEAKCYQHKSA